MLSKKYRAQQDPEFRSLLGLDDQDTSLVMDPPIDEPETEAEEIDDEFFRDEEPTEQPAKPVEQVEEPAWVKLLNQRVEESAAEARAARQEAAATRQEYQRQQQYLQQQQAQAQKPQEEEERFWADSGYVQDVVSKVEQARQNDMRTIHQVALTQEWQNMNALYDAYAAKVNADPDMPKLEEVIPREHVKTTFKAFAANPQAFNGYGQNWEAIFAGAYKEASQPHLVRKIKDAKAQQDELAKKRETKKVENTKNLTKVARSGSVVQEPKETVKRARRDYRQVRSAALRYINSGE